jgi:hypothetical protein
MKAIVKSTFMDIVDECCKHDFGSKRRSTEPKPQLRTLLSTTSEFDAEESNRPVYWCNGGNWVRIGVEIDDENGSCRQETALTGAAAVSNNGLAGPAFADAWEDTREGTVEIQQAPAGTTRVVVRSTFLDVVNDEEVEHPALRRASTYIPMALADADELYIHEGASWQKCADVDSISATARKMSSSETASQQSQSASFDAAYRTDEGESDANSDDESVQVARTLTDPPEERHKRPMRNRHATLPFALASEALQDATNHTVGSQGSMSFPVLAHSIYTPGMCLWQCHLPAPALVKSGAAPEDISMLGSGSSQSKSFEVSMRSEDTRESVEQQRTTLMLRNLPNNYTRDLLIELLNAHDWIGKYDFLYYPVDFQTNSGLGFAFVNCITHADACMVKAALEGFRRWAIPSSKACTVGWCGNEQQGLAANIERYRNSSVMHKSVPDDRKPVIFKDGVRVKLPASTKKLWPPSRQYGLRAKKEGNSK